MKCPNCGEENPNYVEVCSCGTKLNVKKAHLKGCLRIVYIIVGLVVGLSAMVIGRKCAQEMRHPELASAEGMQIVVDSLKAHFNLPATVSDGITMYDIDYEKKRSGKFVLLYFVQVDRTLSELQDIGFDKPTPEGVKQTTDMYCTQMQDFVQKGVGVEYEYYDRNYTFIYEVTILPEDCMDK